MQDQEKKKSPRAPDWDKYLNDENYHDFVTYAKGAKMYSLNYWTFVRLAKEAGASWPLRKTAVVDLLILDEYMDNYKREADEAGKGRLMASRKNIDDMNEAVRKGKKFMRIDEAKDFFSVGKHTVEKWLRMLKQYIRLMELSL